MHSSFIVRIFYYLQVRKIICFWNQIGRYVASSLQIMRFTELVNIKTISKKLKTWSKILMQIFIYAEMAKNLEVVHIYVIQKSKIGYVSEKHS